jgi:hypothetical protein
MSDREQIAMVSVAGATVPVIVEYLDLDLDGVPDAVRIRRAVPGELADGVEQAHLVEELSTSIGIDGVPEDVQVMALR